jgi:CRP/FNR family transcriptional regulator
MVFSGNTHTHLEKGTQKLDREVCYPSCDQCVAKYVSMCSALEEHELSDVADFSKNMKIKPKQLVCAEGEIAEHMFNIKSGCIRISKMLKDGRRQIIGFLFPGEFFGLACSAGYSYTAETITASELCRMPRRELIEKFTKFPKLGQKVLSITYTELQRTQDQMLLLGRKNAKEKLVTFLLNLRNKSIINRNNKSEVFLPMSRSDIADYLGLTIETVSRQFTILSKERIISLSENQFVEILDWDQLKLIASGE